MINIDAQIIEYFTNDSNVTLSEITLNIPSKNLKNCSRLQIHCIPSLVMINIHTKVIFFALQKLITITIVFCKSYQCIMSEMTLNITLLGSNCNRLLKIFYSKMNVYDKHQCTN